MQFGQPCSFSFHGMHWFHIEYFVAIHIGLYCFNERRLKCAVLQWWHVFSFSLAVSQTTPVRGSAFAHMFYGYAFYPLFRRCPLLIICSSLEGWCIYNAVFIKMCEINVILVTCDFSHFCSMFN